MGPVEQAQRRLIEPQFVQQPAHRLPVPQEPSEELQAEPVREVVDRLPLRDDRADETGAVQDVEERIRLPGLGGSAGVEEREHALGEVAFSIAGAEQVPQVGRGDPLAAEEEVIGLSVAEPVQQELRIVGLQCHFQLIQRADLEAHRLRVRPCLPARLRRLA